MTDVTEGIVGVKRPKTRRGTMQRSRVVKVKEGNIIKEKKIVIKRAYVERWLCGDGGRR